MSASGWEQASGPHPWIFGMKIKKTYEKKELYQIQ
jgi:hypothetical protein